MNLTPLRYPGGKSKTYSYIQHVIKLNNCTHYIEPFAGGAGVAIALLLNNDVNKISINDYDISIYAFWFSVLNYTDELIELINNTPITMEEWYKQKEIQLSKKQNTNNLLQLGFSTLFLNRTNRSGILKAGVIGGKNQNGNYKMDCRFNKEKIIKLIINIANKKSKIKLTNKDAESFIKENICKTKNSFTFFDPPYYNKGPALYTNFYEHENHLSLYNTISKKMNRKVWILTYDISETIESLYKDFNSLRYILNYSITKPTKGQEFLIFSKNIVIGEVEKHLKIVF
ncbi:DNA adenine methylase [Staphylococcus xylosus]|uniref:DNA adenine methylase n=1 Tax=Staphylococcus xylosus TaxID=1288 RepID=UPI002DBAE89E|nr:DNA adenine methylase [Staphylococcus xylosus]MEB6244635.1 DNA adenine methylase [Staphylococcus xylosus]MEB7766050.1 DNA adenine methylase [Staphylococcus xylosus]